MNGRKFQRPRIPTYPLNSFGIAGRRIPTYLRVQFRGVTVVTVVTVKTEGASPHSRKAGAGCEPRRSPDWLKATFEVEIRRFSAGRSKFFVGEWRVNSYSHDAQRQL